jgi:heat shock protein HslJ
MITKLTFAFLFCILAACSSPKKESKVIRPAGLHGEWNLSAVFPDTVDIKKGMLDKQPDLVIDTAKKAIGGYSGCNSFGGKFTVTKENIKIGELMATQRGCLESIESRYFENLRRVNRYKVSQDSLKLYATDTLLLTFIKKPAQTKQSK